MRLRIDRSSTVPPYAQVRDGMARLVERGTLAPGSRVPTVRSLADELGLVPNTVARAYRELEGAGLLVARGRSGTFVADRLPARPTDAERRLYDAARVFVTRARQLRVSDADAVRAIHRAQR